MTNNVTTFPAPTKETALLLEELTKVIGAALTLTESGYGPQTGLRERLSACEARVAEYRARADDFKPGVADVFLGGHF